MKLSDKQSIALLQIAIDSLRVNNSSFAWNKADRSKLVEQIMSQQSEEIKEIKK